MSFRLPTVGILYNEKTKMKDLTFTFLVAHYTMYRTWSNKAVRKSISNFAFIFFFILSIKDGADIKEPLFRKGQEEIPANLPAK